MLTVGRFAPSPTGPLHFGSLVAATASYLAARQAQGRWLLRIEDLDKPREQPGSVTSIIQTLKAYGFEWDGDILHQSQRQAAYQAALSALQAHTYSCSRSRKGRPTLPAIRLRTPAHPICFTDGIHGEYCQCLSRDVGDFVLRRADGVFAYQLAVVVDDAFQGVNQVVRGADLLDNTPRQIWLQQLLNLPRPNYAHIPLVRNALGQKLSKQNLAPAISTGECLQTLVAALRFLQQPCPDACEFANLSACWDWAIAHWDIHRLQPSPIQT